MYSAGRDVVIDSDELPLPEGGAPSPHLVASELSVTLVYYISPNDSRYVFRQSRIWSDSDELVEDECVAIVKFKDAYAHTFGPPNDEAFHGHPLYPRGLKPYGVFEIMNSSWIGALEKMNSVHPNHTAESFDRFRHFIISFHESTFECVAPQAECTVTNGDISEVLRGLLSASS